MPHAGEFLVPSLGQWFTPTLQNSWANLAGFTPAGYMKDENGIVRLRGVVASGSASTAVVFTLPQGFRPATRVMGIGVSAGAFVRVDVQTDGTVFIATGGSTTSLSLDSISFQSTP